MLKKIIYIALAAVFSAHTFPPLKERLALWQRESPFESLSQVSQCFASKAIVDMYSQSMNDIAILAIDAMLYIACLPDCVVQELRKKDPLIGSTIERIEMSLLQARDEFFKEKLLTEAEFTYAVETLQKFRQRFMS